MKICALARMVPLSPRHSRYPKQSRPSGWCCHWPSSQSCTESWHIPAHVCNSFRHDPPPENENLESTPNVNRCFNHFDGLCHGSLITLNFTSVITHVETGGDNIPLFTFSNGDRISGTFVVDTTTGVPDNFFIPGATIFEVPTAQLFDKICRSLMRISVFLVC